MQRQRQWNKERLRLKSLREGHEQQRFVSYHPRPKPAYNNYQDISVISVHCDICDNIIENTPDNIEKQIDKHNEINDSFESEFDKKEPKLLLCQSCTKEYLIPSFIGVVSEGNENK